MKQTDRSINIVDQDKIEAFKSYDLTPNDIEFIKEVCKEIHEAIPQKAFNCAQLSALLGATITDHSSIPAVVMSGHLDYNNSSIFKCNKPISCKPGLTTINEIWDGHCWVEIPHYIIDNSIFRTVYYGNFPKKFKQQIIKQFGQGRGTLISPAEQMKTIGFEYIPCFEIENVIIDGLIKGI